MEEVLPDCRVLSLLEMLDVFNRQPSERGSCSAPKEAVQQLHSDVAIQASSRPSQVA